MLGWILIPESLTDKNKMDFEKSTIMPVPLSFKYLPFEFCISLIEMIICMIRIANDK